MAYSLAEYAEALEALKRWRNSIGEQGAGDLEVLNDYSWVIQDALQRALVIPTPPAAGGGDE